MQQYPLIFSDKPYWRLRRHILFWFCWWSFQTFLYSFSASVFNVPYFKRLPVVMAESLFYLIPHMFLCYSTLYYVLPKFLLRGRYTLTVLMMIVLFVITGAISAGMSVLLLQKLRFMIFGESKLTPVHASEINFYLGLLAGLRGSITVGGLAAAIKLMKFWYIKEQRNLQLQKENAESQLTLLKAQIHPHFLFNTLNNIYAHCQIKAPDAAGMIMSLSDLLRHILYDCNQHFISLEKELNILKEYIQIERMRYGDTLDINVNIPSDTNNYIIAPLLLLPLVENAFKHGCSEMLEQPWISIDIRIENDTLHLKLLNGKTESTSVKKGGIGIDNLKQRLNLLYGRHYELDIHNKEEVFIVNLSLHLMSYRTNNPVLLNQKTTSYV